MSTMGPSLGGYTTFLRSSAVGFSTVVLPDSEPIISESYEAAIRLVNQVIAGVDPFYYRYAVYNLGADFVVNWAPDQPGQTFFADLREKWNIYKFISGVVQSSNDVSTGESMVVPEAAQKFTLADLQRLKTPWGRAYLQIAQKYGPTVWGIS